MIISPERPLPDNTQHSKGTEIHAQAGFESTIPASKRPQTHALDRSATLIGIFPDYKTYWTMKAARMMLPNF